MGQQQVGEAGYAPSQANSSIKAPAHFLTIQQVVEQLNANLDDGLTADEVKARLEKYGRNEFGEKKGVQPLKIFIGQIANALTLV